MRRAGLLRVAFRNALVQDLGSRLRTLRDAEVVCAAVYMRLAQDGKDHVRAAAALVLLPPWDKLVEIEVFKARLFLCGCLCPSSPAGCLCCSRSELRRPLAVSRSAAPSQRRRLSLATLGLRRAACLAASSSRRQGRISALPRRGLRVDSRAALWTFCGGPAALAAAAGRARQRV